MQPKCSWETCTLGFGSEREVFDHILRVHASRGIQTCKFLVNGHLCSSKTANFQNFTAHIVTHFSKSFRPFTCDVLFFALKIIVDKVLCSYISLCKQSSKTSKEIAPGNE